MAAGLAVTKEAGTDRFAQAFARAGFTVLAFDYRRLGESGGHPRQVVRIREQLDDWRAALAFARRLPGVDPRRVAIWGFSVSGGHVFRVAAADRTLAAAIAHCRGRRVDAAMNAMQHAATVLRLHRARACARRMRTRSRACSADGPSGTSIDHDAGCRNGPRALNPDGTYRWQQEVAAIGHALRVTAPVESQKITVPLLVLVIRRRCDAACSAVEPPSERRMERS
jgi:alpha-beta hydrolase superfamily lysophospholipase